MRPVRRLIPTLCFVLALVLGFLLAVGLSGCEQRTAGTAPVAASRAAASAPTEPVPVPVPATREPMPSRADLDAGARLAVQGGGATPACMACHDLGSAADLHTRVRAAVEAQRLTDVPALGAAHGKDDGHPEHEEQMRQERHEGAGHEAPRLAGLGAAYLRRQLEAYADGRRPQPVMTPIAQSLLADQRRQLAAYFATLVPSPAPSRALAPDTAATRLAWTGDESRQLPACANCHGRDGSGQADQIPPLAGQPAAYLEAALQAWRSGRRATDASGSMPRIAQALRPGETQALARWYAALPVPPAAAARASAFVATREPLSSGPVAGTSAFTGGGREPGTASGVTAVNAGASAGSSPGAERASDAR